MLKSENFQDIVTIQTEFVILMILGKLNMDTFKENYISNFDRIFKLVSREFNFDFKTTLPFSFLIPLFKWNHLPIKVKVS